MKTFLSTLGLVAVTLAGASAAMAQTTPAPTPAASAAPSPSPSPSPPPKTLQFSGFADAGYTSRIGDTTTAWAYSGIPAAPSRVFDYVDRQPNLQNVNVQALLTAGNLGGKLELSAGTDADIIASYPAAYNGFDLTQAYLTYTAGKFTLQGGKFETLAGAEVIESPSDTQFSRSILFGFAIPFTHTGGRLTYAYNSHLSLIGGVNAGWDEIKSTNGRYTAEYGLAFNPSAAFGLTAQGYTGYEQLANYTNGYNPYASSSFYNGAYQPAAPINSTPVTQQGQRSVLDLVGTYHATGALTFVANYDHGRQGNATGFTADGSNVAQWSGLAGYATYQIDPRLVGSIRYEGFHDADGYRTGFQQFWREGTLTLAYSPSAALTFRGEYRHDVSDQPAFLTTGGFGANTTSTFGLEALVKY